jgi:hypothetical protein
LLRSTFFSDFGSEAVRSFFTGRRASVRLFRATPPAMPARAAPPARSGVFAFDAIWATFSPVLPIGPFDVVRLVDVVRLAVGARDVRLLLLAFLLLDALPLLEALPPRDAFPPHDVLDELFRPVDLLELELVRRERVLEDRVV